MATYSYLDSHFSKMLLLIYSFLTKKKKQQQHKRFKDLRSIISKRK